MNKVCLGLVFLLLLFAAACQPAPSEGELPTLMVLPSLTPAAEAITTDEAAATAPTEPQETPTQTATLAPSETPTERPTLSPTPTRDATVVAGATLTAAVALTPRFATLTPAPDGSQSGGGVAADITITEQQFQTALADQIAESESIDEALVDFVPAGIKVRLTALGGEAFVTGNVILSVAPMGNAARISIDEIQTNSPFPPDEYLEVVNGEFIVALVAALDSVLAERVGSNDVERITVTDDTMEVFLIVES